MYREHFGITEKPFSITPDPRYLYMSKGHQEALAHLLYGIGEGGGFVLLTGEVGTGKTSLCRCLLEQMPEHVDLALILNPRLSDVELIATICDELGISYAKEEISLKYLTDTLNSYLLETHAQGRQVVVMIDEAQNLDPQVLEQIRLLTNLETDKKKLLQIILVGQPELLEILNRKDLRQLQQRVTARFHLTPLNKQETTAYIHYRLSVVGLRQDLFSQKAIDGIYKASGGVPRLINVIADRCLLGAFAQHSFHVDKKIMQRAAEEIAGFAPEKAKSRRWQAAAFGGGAVAAVFVLFLTYGIAENRLEIILDPSGRSASSDTEAGAEKPAAALAETVDEGQPTQAAQGTDTQNEGQQVAAVDPEPSDSDIVAGEIASGDMASGASAAVPVLNDAKESEPAPLGLDGLLKSGAMDQSLQLALQRLFELWGRDYAAAADVSPCELAQRQGLQCYRSDNGWYGLENLNRPALIGLTEDDGRQVYGLVTKLDGDAVRLEIEGRILNSTTRQVSKHWAGDYMVFWQPPPDFSRSLQIGASGPDVAWLKERMAEARPASKLDAPLNAFDQSLHDSVVAFQTANSVRADGVVGARTIIHLNSESPDLKVPLLRQDGS